VTGFAFMCQSTFGNSEQAIRALEQWAATAKGAGHELSNLVALVAIGSDAVQVQMAPRSSLSSALDMVDDAALLGALAVPDDPGQLRVLWSSEGSEDVRHATLSELVSKLSPRSVARDLN
jgi:hypothetical protein